MVKKMTSPCTQTETINNLKTNQAVFMEKLDNLLEKQN
jgi:hypothetical protein